jgi:TrpR-related protein YerC/YecD
MQVSKSDVTKEVEEKIFHALYQVLSDMRKPETIQRFFTDILSGTERTVLAKRLAIATYLKKNKSYGTIKRELRVSSATIATVQKWMEQGGEGLNQAIDTLAADEWAGALAEKISTSVKRMFKKN